MNLDSVGAFSARPCGASSMRGYPLETATLCRFEMYARRSLQAPTVIGEWTQSWMGVEQVLAQCSRQRVGICWRIACLGRRAKLSILAAFLFELWFQV
jgi:hypothetical protein